MKNIMKLWEKMRDGAAFNLAGPANPRSRPVKVPSPAPAHAPPTRASSLSLLAPVPVLCLKGGAPEQPPALSEEKCKQIADLLNNIQNYVVKWAPSCWEHCIGACLLT
jgi:hypothetical protein